MHAGVEACTLPISIQGQWKIADSAGSKAESTVDISSTTMTGISFWEKTLTYDCYIQEQQSKPTDLFEQYDVNVFFCWYLQYVSETQFRLYELTGKGLYTIEERAKAFLNTSSPIINDICEIPYDPTLTYKLMEMSLNP
ncbi:hypothetical protein ACOMHN_039563 [Nucella lapillus]